MSTEIVIGGIFCGKEVTPGVFAEKLSDRRFVIRKRMDVNYAMRIGEVCGGTQYGGGRCFQATTNAGAHVATRTSFKDAVASLAK